MSGSVNYRSEHSGSLAMAETSRCLLIYIIYNVMAVIRSKVPLFQIREEIIPKVNRCAMRLNKQAGEK